jgi:hypothetical protein
VTTNNHNIGGVEQSVNNLQNLADKHGWDASIEPVPVGGE